jgi:hypothetical protein
MPVGDDTWYHVDGGVLTHNLPVAARFCSLAACVYTCFPDVAVDDCPPLRAGSAPKERSETFLGALFVFEE